MRSASTTTCCFSSATLTSRGPEPGLQEERARARLADRARDEALGRVELVDHRHVSTLCSMGADGPAARSAPPRAAPAPAAGRLLPALLLRRFVGASQDRSPSWVLDAST